MQYSADEVIGDQTHKHESLGSNEHECVCVNYVTEKLTLNGRGREGRQTSELLQSRSSHSATLTTHDFVTSAVTQRHLLKEGHFRNASPSTVSVNAPRDFREPGMKRQNGGDQLGTILQFAATDLDARVVPAVSAAAAEPSLLVPSSPLSVTTAPVASPSLTPSLPRWRPVAPRPHLLFGLDILPTSPPPPLPPAPLLLLLPPPPSPPTPGQHRQHNQRLRQLIRPWMLRNSEPTNHRRPLLKWTGVPKFVRWALNSMCCEVPRAAMNHPVNERQSPPIPLPPTDEQQRTVAQLA